MKPSPFIERVRSELRTRHYSLRTEKTYLYWIRHFILFNDKRHPEVLGNVEIEGFLSYLAVYRKVSAATQKQALCAIVFLYRYIIEREIEDLQYGFAKRSENVPTVQSTDCVAISRGPVQAFCF
ncbi:phage integrase N-terminal SAM-like domain-containing protein [Gilvimarinus agarilyticus]|uniref:phage integrase N-terminal SAM-like domain-containing protein n=1 Tax=Gilvimarinus sp. 2_MG-2023 TaxID=3062666 RepID=UPI001C09F16E|nr:phage integrase N-terminal SAM-like domain-containing protein [Gilvimarinus sp. 2_MG-2023]MBU2884956.1 phage integrase N-terminal SAM-like domain-containing protein [Gilvimarinus agarilyticus]MDO6569855.1 phage integrase N-terminal SAM-like domain-containing protein [Gilvimarinus sp. 2_MG-2023]